MIYMETGSTDPTYNLAFEEYCQTELSRLGDILLLWQNDNAVIIGRYQNAEREVNPGAVKDLGAAVVRRSTGGGAVYHDMGNLNYSFIHTVSDPRSMNLARYAAPMVAALQKLGIPARLQGRNDIAVDGKKISGAAQSLQKNRLLHHGTLLYSSNLDVLQQVLQPDAAKLSSKGVESVRSRVANIRSFLGGNGDVAGFWAALLESLGPCEPYTLTGGERAAVRALQREKYGCWEWNRGRAPAYGYTNSRRFPGGRVEVSMEIKRGHIARIQMTGDFLGLVGIEELEAALTGLPHEKTTVRRTLESLPLERFLGGIGAEEMMACLFETML